MMEGGHKMVQYRVVLCDLKQGTCRIGYQDLTSVI